MNSPAAKMTGKRFKDDPERTPEQIKADADYDVWTEQIKEDIKRLGEEEFTRRLNAEPAEPEHVQ